MPYWLTNATERLRRALDELRIQFNRWRLNALYNNVRSLNNQKQVVFDAEEHADIDRMLEENREKILRLQTLLGGDPCLRNQS